MRLNVGMGYGGMVVRRVVVVFSAWAISEAIVTNEVVMPLGKMGGQRA